MNQHSGWLSGITQAASPYFNERPHPGEVDLLVIHNISLPAGEFGGPYIHQLFCGELDCRADPSFKSLEGLEVSAHFLIRRDGSVCQFVSTEQRAWHAGVSSFEGRENCNDFSIGIELEGCDEVPYSAEQYQALSQLADRLMQNYPGISPERITGHSAIAPGRKTDPGPAFDWAYFFQLLKQQRQGSAGVVQL